MSRKEVFTVSLLILSLACIVSAVHGQIEEEWLVRYDGPAGEADEAAGMVMDRSHNIYVTGWSRGVGTEEDITTVKYDSLGNELWVARYNGPGNMEDYATAIAIDTIGFIYVAGHSWDANEMEFVILKYDSLGSEQWGVKMDVNSPGWFDQIDAIAVGPDNNLCVAGTFEGDYLVAKVDPDGNILWSRSYPAVNLNALAVDRRGNVYVTGEGDSQNNYLTVCYDGNGQLRWDDRYQGSDPYGFGEALAIAVDSLGNAFVTGYLPGDHTGADLVTVKYSPQGARMWSRTYNDPSDSYEHGNDIVIDPRGFVYVTGYSWQGWLQSEDFITIKYDYDGNEMWVRSWGSVVNDQAQGIGLDSDGYAYVTGSMENLAGGFPPAWGTLKYDPSGNLVWAQKYEGTGISPEVPSDLLVDDGKNVYVTGELGYGNSRDMATIKYRPIPMISLLPYGDTFLPGDTLTFNATIASNSDDDMSPQVWSTVELPDGSVLDPAFGPASLLIEAGEELSRDQSHWIPDRAVPGSPYTYTVKLGAYPDWVWDSDSFEFTILEP